jgi:two-component system, sensor histidine kinase
MARLRSKSKRVPAIKPARRRPRRRTAPPARVTAASLVAYAHDIRTALTGILALGELLATTSNLGERERRWAASIKDSAQHLASLTTLMIDAAKAETGTLTLQQEPFRPRRLVEALADSLTARAETKGLTATATIANDLPDTLVGDAVRLRAALENLIDNAVKFTERGGVRFEARASNAGHGRARLVFIVTDSGVGLKPAEIKRLFLPFAQANADIARRYGGAGLGLSIVRGLAELMHGDLTVTSAFGRGSSFRLSVVLARASTAADSYRPRQQPQQPPAPTRPLSILCAEDNPYGRVILNTVLGELGHRADFVGSGEEAVAAVVRGYDAVLMDVALPGMDGLEATRRVRALAGAVGRTPVIGITGRTEAADEQAARAAGMDFYLRKPVSPSALSEALAAARSNSKNPESC